jgi:hypothetical protein
MASAAPIRRPHCNRCRKTLLWDYVGRAVTPRRHRFRSGRDPFLRRRMRMRSQLAIRCLYCNVILCRSCARKHFAPVQRAQRAVDKRLEKAALRLLARLGSLCKVRTKRSRAR